MNETFNTIAITLANIYDWDSNDLQRDFVNHITGLHNSVSKDMAIKIFNTYDNLPTNIRDDIQFDYNSFLADLLD